MLYAAPPAAAPAECVRVVVDYGTFLDSPSGPVTNCTSVAYGASAADTLAKRATQFGKPAPRYASDGFLCGIDGYPHDGCGEQAGNPYWSFWVWRHGAWTYSSVGVASYAVQDSDKDGHPDPIGFRYADPSTGDQPRADPGYPAPRATAPPPTTAPPRPGATATVPAGGTRATETATATATAGATATPGGTSPGGAPPSGTPSPVAALRTARTTAPGPATPPDVVARTSKRSFPVGLAGGGVLAAALLGAAAWRFRTPGAR
jgi:hypothetical protein